MKEVHTFPKRISLKVNVIALLELEPAYYVVTVQHVNLFIRGILHLHFAPKINNDVWKCSSKSIKNNVFDKICLKGN